MSTSRARRTGSSYMERQPADGDRTGVEQQPARAVARTIELEIQAALETARPRADRDRGGVLYREGLRRRHRRRRIDDDRFVGGVAEPGCGERVRRVAAVRRDPAV